MKIAILVENDVPPSLLITVFLLNTAIIKNENTVIVEYKLLCGLKIIISGVRTGIT